MSVKIRVLDENTINKIAAGEVIENPASVVKELVENALDAGARDICVEINAGGRQLIRVSDDGCGMSRDDAILSLERHATSKIRDVEDIFSIDTMGFRGEAVPSIASVSKFTLLTSDGKDGSLIIVDGGKIQKNCEAARSQGTTIEVKNLFFNVPVRKKFQRSPSYDATEIQKRLSLFALVHPEVKFRLVHNQKTLLSVKAQEDWVQRAAEVLGQEYVAGTCPIHYKSEELEIRGLIGVPSFTRHNRTGQYLFVNERPITAPFISYSVRDAYGSMLPSNRHPVFLLFMKLPGGWVDINVHPQKKEARFRREQHLREVIAQAVESALRKAGSSAAVMPAPPLATPPPSFSRPPAPRAAPMPRSAPSPWRPSAPVTTPLPPKPRPAALVQELIPAAPPTAPRVLAVLPPYLLLDAAALPGEGTGLAYIDPRAARARIFFERMKKDDAAEVPSQRLLIPVTMECSVMESSLLNAFLPDMQRLGLQMEPFGENSFVVNGIPPGVKMQEAESYVRQLLDSLQEIGAAESLAQVKERRLAALSARAAAAAPRTLSLHEAQVLVDQLLRCEQPFRCPLGKPTVVVVGDEEIAKKFER